ncbi:DUF4214 domain-containing protein [Pigmentiphaga aceris]|uniref:DUF4214 domain-containing protein n=1 Tax=Pigmentiphaga aceris TaxID=1940612 RepID=A0A5C0AXA0_9BURK|nr:DUF4214 domain-containing protein [Pigmentiphaga aceris]QEI05271.1 DUF4214 domain-containing protein [Pigmentiphaga aceris]
MATITPTHQDLITRLYVGLFNRAPDAQGLQFWAQALADGASLGSLAGTIFTSPEAQTIYPATQTADQFVTAFYQTVFGRVPDTEGLRFWTGVLQEAGGVTSQEARALLTEKIIEIVSTTLDTKPTNITDTQFAETVSDRTIFSKKVAAGLKFAVEQQGTDLGQAKQALVDAVAPPPATTPSEPVAPVVGQTYTLTTNDDRLTGTAGDDTFNAAAGTLQSADVLDGGAGTDTLNIFTAFCSQIRPTLSNIEIVNVTSGSSGASTDLGGSTGITHVGFVNSTSAGTVRGVGNAALSVTNQNQQARFQDSTATALSMSFKTVGGDANRTTVNLSEAAATSYTITTDSAHVNLNRTGTGASTGVTVAATGNNSLALSGNDASTVQTLTVTGTGSVNFSGQQLSALTSVTAGDGGVTLNSTNATANALSINTGAGIDTITANGASINTLNTGAGNDVVTLNTGALASGATVNLGDGNDIINLAQATDATIDGGMGTDTLNITANGSGSFRPTLRNIEIVNLTGIDGSAVIDLGGSTGITQVGFVGNSANFTNEIGFINVGNAALSVTDQSGGARFSGSTATALSLTLKNVGSTNVNSSIHLAAETAALATSHDIVIENSYVRLFETIQSAAVTAVSVAATGTNKLMLSSADAASVQTLTVSGAGAIDLSGRTLTALTTLNDTGSGALTLKASGTLLTTLNGGSGNDTITVSGTLSATARINLGAGNDTITLSNSATLGAVVDGGEGDDTFITGTTSLNATDTLSGGAGADRFFFGASATDVSTDWRTAIITDFQTGIDKIAVRAGGDAVLNVNFVKAGATVADFATLLADASATLNGTVRYYLGQITGEAAYLVTDLNGVGRTNIIQLTGVTLDSLNASDIIADFITVS